MSIDRDVFFDVLGGEEAAAAMSDEAKADALEHYLIESLNDTAYLNTRLRRGAGDVPAVLDAGEQARSWRDLRRRPPRPAAPCTDAGAVAMVGRPCG